MSTDISLPRDKTPLFPDRCVGCGTTHPRGQLQLATRSIGWWTWLLWTWGRRVRVEVPCCDHCRATLKRNRWIRGGVTAIAGLTAGYLAYKYTDAIPRALRKWAAMGLGLLVLAPLIGWEVFFPQPVDITAYSDHIDYEFKDPRYACEFADLNGASIDT